MNHKGRVTVFVPHYPMSGGTLMALAADEIAMDPNAVLGPVDPQTGDMPAASIVRAVKTKGPQNVEDMTLILADISSKAISHVGALIAGLLERRMAGEKAKELAALISTGQFTHDFPITVERARAVGLPTSTDMPESIYTLMGLCPKRGWVGPRSITSPSRGRLPRGKRDMSSGPSSDH
jgi:ClpP class serine protease